MTDALAAVTAVAGTARLGHTVRWSASTGSTNDDLKALARAGAAEGLVLVTDEQLAGRGRRGRSWSAPAGSSLLQSVLLRPTWLAPESSFLLTMLAAVAAAEALTAAGATIELKWPNDLEADGKKLGGILVEAELSEQRIGWAVLGLGLNINGQPSGDPEITARATSLAALTDQRHDRAALFAALIRRLDEWYGRVRQGEQSALRAAWERRLSTLGQAIQAETAQGPLLGEAVAVAADGGLVVRTAAGVEHTLHAADVSVRRR